MTASMISVEKYNKRQVPQSQDSARWAQLMGGGIGWLATEFGNIQRAIPPYYVSNVQSFGALGDGITNDTSAIAAAARATLTNGGGTLYFPPGRYLTDPIQVFGPNGVAGTVSTYTGGITITGDGACLVQNNPGSLAAQTLGILNLKWLTNCKVLGLEFDGNRSHWPASAKINHSIAVYGCDNLEIAGNYLHDQGRVPLAGVDWQGDGVYIHDLSSNIRIHDNTFASWGRWAVACVAAVTDLNVTNNVGIRRSTDATTGALGFFDFEAVDGAIGRSITVDDNTAYYNTAIFCITRPIAATQHNVVNLSVQGNRLIGSYLDAPATYLNNGWGFGVMIDTAQYGVISGNLIHIGDAAGFCLQALANNGQEPDWILATGNVGINAAGGSTSLVWTNSVNGVDNIWSP